MKPNRILFQLSVMLILSIGFYSQLFADLANAPESPYPANGATGVQLQDLRLQWSQTSAAPNQPYQYSLYMWASPKTIPGYTYKFTWVGTHYYLSSSAETWQNAKTICNNNKWRIGSAHNSVINNNMASNDDGVSTLIGLSDWVTESSYRWEDGRAFSYTNWASGEPNGGTGENYVEMFDNGTWNDCNGYAHRYWIEVDSWVSHTQTTGNNYYDLNCKLEPNTQYNWSIYTRNSNGYGPTANWSFTTGADGIAPSSFPAWGSPDSAVATAPLNPTLSWAPVANATYYKLYVYRSRGDRLGTQYAIYNGHVYQKTTTALNYADSKAAVEANGGYLVAINDAAEQAILPTDYNYWIGLNDVSGDVLSGEGWFIWNVGETNAFTNWDLNYTPPEPNGQTSENFVIQGTSGKWYDAPGTNTYRSLYEYPADILDGVVVNGTSFSFKDTKLPANTLYRWTAVPYNEYGRPFASTQWSFMTNNDGGSVPGTIAAATISPANTAINVPINTSLSWVTPSGSPTEYYSYLGTGNSITNAGNYTDLGIYNGHRYYKSNHGYTWHWAAANAQVQKDGGYLASIGSATEDAIFNSTDALWLGASDRVIANTFKYANGDPWSYKNWITGEPNNFADIQYYITKNRVSGNQWDDDNANTLYKFAVEVAPNIANGTRITSASYTPALLRFNTTYYWSAVGSNNQGMANDTQRWSFTTTDGKAVNPIPASGATISTANKSFDWDHVSGANGYNFYLGTSPGNWNIVNIFCPTSNYTYAGAVLPATYYWKLDTVTSNETVTGNTWAFTAYDFPENDVVVVAPDISIAIIGGDANNVLAPVGTPDPYPNPMAVPFYTATLQMVGAGPWTITYTTTAPVGIWYSYTTHSWTIVHNVGGTIVFEIPIGGKGIPEVPIALGDQTLPVELSSFSATLTAQSFVKLTWVSQTETGLSGYRVYRSLTGDVSAAIDVSGLLEPTNSSQSHTYTHIDKTVFPETTYCYWLEAVELNGTATFYGPNTVYVTTPEDIVPSSITAISNAYPNPFKNNTGTNITYEVKAGETGTITIYNIVGQVVKTFPVRETSLPVTFTWNGHDSKGNACGSGMYFYKLSTPSCNVTKKLVIVN